MGAGVSTAVSFTACGPKGTAKAEPLSGGDLWRVALTHASQDAQYFNDRAEAVQAARILSGTITLR